MMNKYILKTALLASIATIIMSTSEYAYAEEIIMKRYLERELDYYKKNPQAIKKDIMKDEIVIDPKGKN